MIIIIIIIIIIVVNVLFTFRAMCICQSSDLSMPVSEIRQCWHVLKFHLEVSAWAELHIVSDMGALDIGFAIKKQRTYRPEISHK